MTNQPDPHEALASIREARSAMGRDLDYPAGWDVFYGAICGALVLSQGLPTPWSLVLLVGSVAAMALMVRWWRARTGWWVNGYGPPKARWVAFGLAAVLLALISVSVWARFNEGPIWVPFAAGLAGALAAGFGGRLWMKVYRQDLRDGGQ